MALTDSFGRTHTYLRISLTERCNLRCTYCMPAEGVPLTPRAHLMTAEEIDAIATEFVRLGITKIRLTGGEPLVRKDAADIIERLGRLPVELTLTTNVLLVPRFLNVFAGAGVRSLNVSLDTLNPQRFEAFTRRKGFEETLRNIDLLLENGFRVKSNAVIMRGQNDDELLDFVRWTEHKPIHVRFIEFMPFDGNRWQWDKVFSYREMLERIQAELPTEKLTDAANDTAKAYRVPGYQGTFAVISSMTNHFCGTCNRLRLTANGKVRNCLFSDEETDVLTALRAGQAIEPIIRAAVQRKKQAHGGIQELAQLGEGHPELPGRSMILIGG